VRLPEFLLIAIEEDLGGAHWEVGILCQLRRIRPAANGRDGFPPPCIMDGNQQPSRAALPKNQPRISLNDDIANNRRSARGAHTIEHCSFDVPDISGGEVIFSADGASGNLPVGGAAHPAIGIGAGVGDVLLEMGLVALPPGDGEGAQALAARAVIQLEATPEGIAGDAASGLGSAEGGAALIGELAKDRLNGVQAGVAPADAVEFGEGGLAGVGVPDGGSTGMGKGEGAACGQGSCSDECLQHRLRSQLLYCV